MAKLKTSQLNKLIDAYLDIADEKLSDGDVIGGMVMIHNALRKNHNDKDALMMLADAYADCNMHELAVNAWFRFLSVCNEDEKCQAYGGLGLNYYCLGKNFISAYYMNKQVLSGGIDDEDSDSFADFAEEVLSPFREKRGFAFADDLKKEKEREKIAVMHKDVLCGDIDGVLAKFDDFDENSEYYADALNEVALAYMFSNETEQALKYTKKSLELNPHGFDALCNASVLYYYSGDDLKSATYASLAEKEIGNDENRTFRLASSFCEQRKFEKAEKYLVKMLDYTPYDVSLYYLLAITYYNLCKFEDAVKYFRKIIQLTDDKRVAGYYLNLASNEAKKKDRAKKTALLSYTFQVPAEERKRLLKLIDEVLAGKVEMTEKDADYLNDALDWCFSTKDDEVERAAGALIASCASEKKTQTLNDLLLDAFLFDSTKKVMIKALALRGYNRKIKFVYSNIYREIKIKRLSFFRNDDDLSLNTLEGYAIALSEVAPLMTGDCNAFSSIAEDVYYKLLTVYNGKKAPFSPECIGAYIAITANGDRFTDEVANVCADFGCKAEDYARLLSIINGERNEENS